MDLDGLAQSWRRRAAASRRIRLERAERARQAAARAAIALRGEFGVAEVWLFGSLASDPVHDDFDVDLAVRDLQPERSDSGALSADGRVDTVGPARGK